MKRKKAIKKKKEDIADINSKILDAMGDTLKHAAKKEQTAFGLLAHALHVRNLAIQKSIIVSKPIPPKKFKQGGIVCNPCILNNDQTEKIINHKDITINIKWPKC